MTLLLTLLFTSSSRSWERDTYLIKYRTDDWNGGWVKFNRPLSLCEEIQGNEAVPGRSDVKCDSERAAARWCVPDRDWLSSDRVIGLRDALTGLEFSLFVCLLEAVIERYRVIKE
jgi:hypothetical protein